MKPGALFEEEEVALSRAKPCEFLGATLSVASAEDLVIYKLASWRDLDRVDLRNVLERWRDRLDLSYLRKWVGEIARQSSKPELTSRLEDLLAGRE